MGEYKFCTHHGYLELTREGKMVAIVEGLLYQLIDFCYFFFFPLARNTAWLGLSRILMVIFFNFCLFKRKEILIHLMDVLHFVRLRTTKVL